MSKKTSSTLSQAVVIIGALTCIFPLVWLLISSLKTQPELYANPWGLPENPTISNYLRALLDGEIGKYFVNSVIISLISVALTVVLSMMAAYGIMRLKWRISKLVLAVFMLGMMLPSYCSIIPLYAIFNKMEILNSYLAVIIPHVTFGLAMGIFIMSGFLVDLPRELEEAAIIDGCSLIKSFLKIVLPLMRSALVTVAVITFVNVWNDLLYAQIFLNDDDLMPLPVGLTQFEGMYGTDYVGMIAAIIITVVPAIIIYSALHDKIIDGMTAGAIKG